VQHPGPTLSIKQPNLEQAKALFAKKKEGMDNNGFKNYTCPMHYMRGVIFLQETWGYRPMMIAIWVWVEGKRLAIRKCKSPSIRKYFR